MGSKYTGMIFAFAGGCTLLVHRHGLRLAAVYGMAVLVAGSQWYGWNYVNTGDPIFPLLHDVIPYKDHVPWNADIQAAYRTAITEKPLPTNLFWLFAYPVAATLFGHPAIESLRVGLGPVLLMLAPFAAAAIWRFRRGLATHPLFTFGAVCAIAYGIWFFFGPSQRVRHLLPLYPLVLVCVAVAAQKAAAAWPASRLPVAVALASVIALQLAGAGLFGLNYLRFAVTGQSRDEFLLANVSDFQAVIEARKFLRPDERIMVSNRQLVYYFDVPVFYANFVEQAVVSIHERADDLKVLWRQLMQQRISAVLLPFGLDDASAQWSYAKMAATLREKECLDVLTAIDTVAMVSRTLPGLGTSRNRLTLVRLTPDSCKI